MAKNNAGKLQEFLQGIGAIAEMTRLYYDQYLRVGFTTSQAFDLAKNLTIAHIQVAAAMNGGDREGAEL